MKKQNLRIAFYIVAIILAVLFLIFAICDTVNYSIGSYAYGSSPLYVYYLIRGLEFLVPSVVFFVLAKLIKK